jgi:hypothetical protein
VLSSIFLKVDSVDKQKHIAEKFYPNVVKNNVGNNKDWND